MLKEHLKGMVSSIFAGDPVKAESHFKSAMDIKLAEALESRKGKVAARLFGTKVREDWDKGKGVTNDDPTASRTAREAEEAEKAKKTKAKKAKK